MDTPPLLRNSEVNDFWRCWWLWWEHWVNGTSPLRAPTWSVFGVAWHAALEYVYGHHKRTKAVYLTAQEVFLKHLDDSARKVGIEDWEDYEEEQNENSRAKLVPAKELGPKMLMNYWYTYGPEREWEFIHTEQPFQINVPFKSGPGVLVVQAGTWDALAWHRPTRRYWLWDHKSCKSFPQPEYLELDGQAGTYLWVAKKVLVHKGLLDRRDKISGIQFNYAKKHPGDERPRNNKGEALNKDGSVSKRQPTELFLRYEAVRTPQQQVALAHRVQDTAMIMRQIRNGELPIVKNTTKDCPRCVLFDLCTAHESGEDWEYLRDELYTKRDLYEDHREDMRRAGIELSGR